MLKLIAGFLIGAGASVAIGSPWVLVVVFLVGGIVAQMAFARSLNKVLDGDDPVALGARSISALKALRPIPFQTTLLNFVAKALFWASLVAALAGLGMVRVE